MRGSPCHAPGRTVWNLSPRPGTVAPPGSSEAVDLEDVCDIHAQEWDDRVNVRNFFDRPEI